LARTAQRSFWDTRPQAKRGKNTVKSAQRASASRSYEHSVTSVVSLFLMLCLPFVLSARSIDLSRPAQRRAPFHTQLSKAIQLRPNEDVLVTDLDRNGVSELVIYPTFRYRLERGPLQLATYSVFNEQAQIIQQEPILGPVVPTGVRELDVLDAPGNELVIAYVRGDQLRCRIWNYQKVLRRDYILYRHSPSDSVWDVTAVPAAALDANSDGRNEILFLFYAGYAHMPRGWLLLQPETGKILQRVFFGGPPTLDHGSFARDFDNDGHLEILLGTCAPENHFELNGVSDLWAYVLAYDLVTGQREFSKIMGPFYGSAQILGPGPTSDTWVASYHGTGGSARQSRSRLSLFRWKSTVPVRELFFTSRFESRFGPDYDGDGVKDLYCALLDRSELWVVSSRLNVLSKSRLKNPPHGSFPGPFFRMATADVNLDGQKELVLNLGGALYILNKELRPLVAVNRSKQLFRGVLNRGTGELPFLVTEDLFELKDRNVHLWQLAPTPAFVRYAPSHRTAYAALAVLLVGGAVVTLSALRNARLNGRLLTLSLQTSGIQVVSVDSKGRIQFSQGPSFLKLRPRQHVRDALRAKPLQTLVSVVEEWQRTGRLTKTTLTVLPTRNISPLLVQLETTRRNKRLLLVIRPSDHVDGTSAQPWRALLQQLVRQLEGPVAAAIQKLRDLQESHPDSSSTARQVVTQVQHLQKVLKQFAKLVDPEQRDLQPLELHTFLQEWGNRKVSTLPQKVELMIEVPASLPPVNVDADQLVQVLENLLENAVQAMPDGGLVRVSARYEHGLPRDDDTEPRDYVVIEVKDSGKGIPSDLHGKIFDPGFTTSPGKAGFGLFVVRKIAQDHGGFVEVSSAPGVGTIVSFFLPAE